jgi:hypothetical protein
VAGEAKSAGGSVVAVVVVVAGLLANVVAIAGSVADWGDDTTTVVLSSQPVPDTTTTTVADTTTTTVRDETPEAFITRLDEALRTGDVAFLSARLHPAVINRYGAEVCAAHLETLQDTYTPRTVTGDATGPASYDWKTDGMTTTIADIYSVPIEITTDAAPQRQEVHTTEVDGTFRWFSDCTNR